MTEYAAAKLSGDGVPLEFVTGGVKLSPGDAVVLSTDTGERYAVVVPDVPSSCGSCTGCAVKKRPARLARIATSDDQKNHQTRLRREGDAYRSALMKIKERRLSMKLIRVQFEMDGSRATFFYTAENRIDFRALVRELSRELQDRFFARLPL